jgi:RNA polymerase subunit RPABC4/transcription elongation factor Spt4
MFLFIGGIQPRTVVLESLHQSCPVCGKVSVKLKRVDHYIAVFFIPLLRVKKGNPFLYCQHCNLIVDEKGRETAFEHPDKQQKCRYCKQSFNPAYSYCPYCGKPVR